MRKDVEMSFGDHLDELRRRVIYAVVGLVVAAAVCGVNYEFLLSALMRPYKRAYEKLISSKLKAEAPDEEPGTRDEQQPLAVPEDSPLTPVLRAIDQRLADLKRRLDAIAPEPEAGPEASEDSIAYAQRFPAPRVIQGGPLTGYVTAILLCVICGIILGSPWILYQIWAFVGVGLYAHERRFVYFYGPFSFALFISGAAAFYFVMLPVALGALMAPTAGIMVDGMPIIDPSLFLNDYFKFVAMMTLIFGIVFQTPLVVMFIAWTGIVPLGTLVRKQRIVILVLAIASAVLTPQDPVTMVMMAIPLIVLYQLGLLLAWITLRKKRRREAEEGERDWWGGDDETPGDDEGLSEESPGTPPTPGDDEGAAEESPGTPDESATPAADQREDETYPEDDLYEYEREYGQYDDEDLYGYGDEDYDEPDESEAPGDDEGPTPGDDEGAAEESPGTSDEEPPPSPDDAEDPDAGIPPEDRMK